MDNKKIVDDGGVKVSGGGRGGEPDGRWKKTLALFLSAQAVTLIGSSLVTYSIIWYVALNTQSGSMMSAFTVAAMLPMFFVSPFGGVWADRYDRKLLINLADGFIAVVTLAIAVCFSLGVTSLVLLLVCSAVRSIGSGVQVPAIGAIIPQIVPEEHLVRANGIYGSIQSLSMLGSPALAGALMSFAPIQTVFFIDVVTAACGISILAFLVKVPKREKQTTTQSSGYFKELKSGLSYIRHHSFMLRYFLFVSIFMVLLTPAAMLTVLQVTRDFGPDVWRLSAVEIAFSAGMAAGGAVIGVWGGFRNKMSTIVVGLVLFGVEAIGLGLFTSFIPYLVCMLVMGLTVPLANTPGQAIVQTKTDPNFMGRVFSVLTMISSVIMPLSMVVFGPLGDIVTIDSLLIATGIGSIALGFVMRADKKMMEAGE